MGRSREQCQKEESVAENGIFLFVEKLFEYAIPRR
jgi:hypothetical protein